VKEAMSRGALIWDVRSQNVYLRGHIPGAINIDDISDVLRDPRTEDYIAISEIERILGEAGIDASREMVLYGSKARPGAYFGYITLRYLGVAKVTVYHGGIDDWKDGGNPVDTDLVKLPPTTFTANPDESLLATTREVIRKIDDPSVQIIDARSVNEYNGEDVRALRGGHVPGALNIPYQTNWVDPETPRKLARKQVDNKDGMNLKPREALQAMYAQLDPDKETIVYCQSGSRASVLAAVLQELGFSKVRLYDSSWLGYGNSFDAPVESVTYFNVGRVNRMMRSMQHQIDLLEGEIEALKTRQK
jgi:thiosulfate/3-mercaptopyruvate sulfurtransferase